MQKIDRETFLRPSARAARWMRRSRLARALLVFLAIGNSIADSLSKEEIIQLQKGGVDSQAIVTKVKKDGINFQVTPAVMVELTNLGLPPELIRAIVDAERPTAPNWQGDVQTLYHEGKYPELVQKLQAYLTENSNDTKSRALLALCLLRLNEVDLAEKEVGTLRSTDATSTYTRPIEEILKSTKERQTRRAALLEALKESRRGDIPALIDKLDAPALQKAILHVYLSMYEADFDAADKTLASISVSSYADTLRLRTLNAAISDAKKQYKGLVQKIEVYLHSPLAPSSCGPHEHMVLYMPDFAALTIEDYTKLVSNLSQIAPLSDFAMDLGVHLAMIRSTYPDFERFADQILKIKGNIRIPGFAEREYFDLVLDAEKKRISTQPVRRDFVVRYSGRGGKLSKSRQSPSNPGNSSLVSFDWAFSEIRGISQFSSGQEYGPLAKRQYALKLAPSGLVPHYALMHLVQCTGGLNAQLSATRNLGQYVVHLIGPTQIPVKLEDPERQSSGGGWQVAALAAAYGGVMAQRGNVAAAELANQVVAGIQQSQEQRAAAEASQQATWYATAMRETFSFQDSRSFAEMEKLVGLTQ